MRILHLTDLHVGMANQEWLWPTAKKGLLEDLARLYDKVGGPDIVIFSGDLTQKATREEYSKLNDVLGELWKLFKSHGATPPLFPVPGNHDLARPKPMDPTALAMKMWWESPNVRQAFWKNDPKDYRKFIDSVFSTYMDWLNGLEKGPIPLVQLSHGILPGDVVAEMKIGDISLGLVGLNTAWLQLEEGDYQRKIDADPRQLMALTNNDPDAWCKKHDFNLLITHHPQEWLHPTSLEMWRSEVHTPSRFDAHLFGHMHDASIASSSEGGAQGRRYIQGASMFGLEVRSGGIERIHGYSVLQLRNLDNGQHQLRQWPRRAHKGRSAVWKLIPDPDFDCDDSGAIEYCYGFGSSPVLQQVVPVSNSATLSPAAGRASLRSLRKSLSAASAFADVRGVEKELASKALATKRALWLVSDWGLGDEQFIRALQFGQPVEKSFLYELDCQNFFKRDDIYAGVQEQIGCSFEQMCEQISLEGPCILVLDDLPILEGSDKATHQLQRDVELLVEILLQYCSDIRLIIKSRRLPINCALSVVELRPFDEADTMAYVANHEQGGRNLATAKFVGQLFRHTDGIPTRIDRALRDVQIVGVAQMHTLNSDVAGKSAAVLEAPSGLIETLRELEQSADPTAVRAFKLLKVLTMFPRGEQLATVKRFYGASQFYPQDARILLDAALVDAVEIPSIDVESNEAAKALVVRRPVREYLYASLPANELKSLNRQSLELYFGKEWASKGIKSPKHMRFNEPRCGAWQIGNASMLILRAAREAVEGTVASRWLATRDLASAYCTNLTSGNHFLAVISLSEDLLPLLEGVDAPPELSVLRADFAKALRMTGQSDRAIEICMQVQSTNPNKKLLQSTHLTLALCYEGLNRVDEARKSANACIQLDPRSNLSLQARSIAIGLQTEKADRQKNLRLLEAQARKKKAFVVANNIALSLADECTDPVVSRQLVSTISEQAAANGDYHNAIRSIIRLSKMHLDDEGALPVKLLVRLIDTYHYLYGEDIQGLFRRCHAALWRAFEGKNEVENLLRLFRYSSLKWRVRGLDTIEAEYVGHLSRVLGDRMHGDFGRTNRELAYFLARTGQAIKLGNSEISCQVSN